MNNVAANVSIGFHEKNCLREEEKERSFHAGPKEIKSVGGLTGAQS